MVQALRLLALSLLLAVPAIAAGDDFKHCHEPFTSPPVSIHGSSEARHDVDVKLPPSCQGKDVRVTYSGGEERQYAVCEFEVAYASGGSSRPVEVLVEGLESGTVVLESAVNEPGRQVRGSCLAENEYRAMRVTVCVSCGGDAEERKAFEKELERFLDY
ncbi:hypothetical protein [Desulfohalovibrio reitneri]|uniref:hypothetical protein n=1 Tax=Desulfohalovibrio reitneri TaxID=1307759 RepID=UPI0004A714FE|nr:hypothetical protein [Desulfohalovibrio reitneri]